MSTYIETTTALLAFVLAAGCTGASPGPAPAPAANPACVAGEPALGAGFDAATRDDPAFNRDFQHCFTTVNGVQMHYVVGGTGPQTLVLLHGWPESWYEYREVMPRLLPGRTVIAVDLPGMGDSTGELPTYTKTVMADHVHLLLRQIGRPHDVRVVAHDFGVGVAYALAARHPEQVAGLLLMDFALVGKKLTFDTVRPLSWHFSFNLQKPLAEEIVTGREGAFLRYFFQHSQISAGGGSHQPEPLPVSERSLAEYTRVYARPQVLRAGFELYRTWPQDEAENSRLQDTPLTMPVRLLAQDGFAALMLPALRAGAPAATGADVPGAGHWMVDQRPDQVTAEINSFYPAG